MNTPIAYPRPHIHAEDWAEFLGEKFHPQQAYRCVRSVLLMVIAGGWEISRVLLVLFSLFISSSAVCNKGRINFQSSSKYLSYWLYEQSIQTQKLGEK